MKNISKLKLYVNISESSVGEHKRKSYLLALRRFDEL